MRKGGTDVSDSEEIFEMDFQLGHSDDHLQRTNTSQRLQHLAAKVRSRLARRARGGAKD